MNKRLRKKKFVREYTFLGFEVEATVSLKENFDSFIDDFINFIEENNLSFGGGGGKGRFTGIVQMGYAKDFDDTKKSKVTTWLRSRKELSDLVVGEVRDLNKMENSH